MFERERSTEDHAHAQSAASMGWLRSVGSMKLGRTAARRTAPKLPRAIRVRPNERDTKMGGGVI